MGKVWDNRKVIEKEEVDVLVVGGGIAGISAAVSAARKGAKTLLVEKQVNLGGLATCGLISWYEPLCDGNGNQVMSGMAEELIRLSCRDGFDNLPAKWGGDESCHPRNERYSTFFSPTVFSLALDEFVLESGARIRFDTLSVCPVMEGNLCKGVLTESVSGREFFPAKVVIDATGDASVMERAGVPVVAGQNYMTYIAHGYDKNDLKTASEDGDLCHFRRWINAGSDMYGNGHPDGMGFLQQDSAEEVTDYLLTGKRRLLERCRNNPKGSYDIMTLPTMPQYRTIRHIIGEKEFRAEVDAVFEDCIGLCSDFRPDGRGKIYQMPFGALYNKAFPNLLAAGRIISAPAGDGWEVARVIPVCALTGEAAGKAAAELAKGNKEH